MVLFEFDKIIKNKYDKYKKKNNNVNQINFDEFKSKGLEKISELFPFYFSGINQNYIENILNSNKTHIIISCIGDKFDIKNITSILTYHKTTSLNTIKYYILLLGTHERFRKYGYGKIILDEFIEFVKKANNPNKKIKILLKSLEKSSVFYITNGFVKSELKSNRLFFKYETVQELKLNEEKILELDVN
jgi:GNAT superfamily N-acetyltransferase